MPHSPRRRTGCRGTPIVTEGASGPGSIGLNCGIGRCFLRPVVTRFASRSFELVDGSSVATLRQEIAIRAGRLIAEEGLDYASAKRKAARDIVGSTRASGEWLPANEEIEVEVRAYQALFQADTQPARLQELRVTALALMQLLERFRPYLIGAVMNGTAGDYSGIHLELYAESAKEVEIFLLNQGIEIDVGEVNVTQANGRARSLESIQFLWRAHRHAEPEGVELIVHDTDGLRGGLSGERRGERVDRAALEALLAQGES